MGKLLTLDSVHGQWNAPNWSWWPDLLPLVDGITSMGYEQSGRGVDYQELVDLAAVAPQKLMIGVPSYHGTWLGHGVSDQLGWLVQQGRSTPRFGTRASWPPSGVSAAFGSNSRRSKIVEYLSSASI